MPRPTTSPLPQGRGSKQSRSPRMALISRRPSRRGVDRNHFLAQRCVVVAGRPSRRGVDRNEATAQIERAPFVAPPAGAWIETSQTRRRRRKSGVAPPAGAWIETSMRSTIWTGSRSRPSRRGVDRNRNEHRVIGLDLPSPLPQGRGSKQPGGFQRVSDRRSPLPQGRGSKHGLWSGDQSRRVAPPAGAWIETSAWGIERWPSLVAPPAGAWIETPRSRACG